MSAIEPDLLDLAPSAK